MVNPVSLYETGANTSLPIQWDICRWKLGQKGFFSCLLIKRHRNEVPTDKSPVTYLPVCLHWVLKPQPSYCQGDWDFLTAERANIWSLKTCGAKKGKSSLLTDLFPCELTSWCDDLFFCEVFIWYKQIRYIKTNFKSSSIFCYFNGAYCLWVKEVIKIDNFA